MLGALDAREPIITECSPCARDDTLNRSGSATPGYLAARFGAARPRLVRAARAQGFPPDVAEDVAQETMLEAWRHHESVCDTTGLDAWLNAICRYVCRRFWRRRALADRRFVPLVPEPLGEGLDTSATDITSTGSFTAPEADLAEELERQDLETLLDRALGHLTPAARDLMEQCYLRDTPQREVAARLGLSTSALEARLHRARRQLRAVLAGDLRAEADAFDLAVSAEVQPGWRESRIWCPTCGRHRLRGAFEPLPRDGGINLHLVCPGCGYQVNSGGVVPLEGLTSFRPAYKRLLAFAAEYVTQGISTGQQTCPLCGAVRPMRLDGPDGLGGSYMWPGLTAVLECPTCAIAPNTLAALLVWLRPEVQRFQECHPRCINEPEARVEYEGQPALRIRLRDILSAARLTLFVHAHTLDVLASFEG